MNWYKISKKEDKKFNFDDLTRDIWNTILKKEQKKENIHFDLENKRK